MMKKTYNLKEVYQNLESNRKRLARRSIILAMFFLGINIYAWFIYISKVDVNVDANVVAWDINFYDGPDQVKEININEKIYPGMPIYHKRVIISNGGETKAKFDYKITKINILGIDSMIEDGTLEEQVASLENDYPFIITLSANKTELDINEQLEFNIAIQWEFEDLTKTEFLRLTKHYTFDPSVTYYGHTDQNYEPYNATASNFQTHKLDLYLEKDDADSFFGEACADYERQTKNSCVSLSMTLEVNQEN